MANDIASGAYYQTSFPPMLVLSRWVWIYWVLELAQAVCLFVLVLESIEVRTHLSEVFCWRSTIMRQALVLISKIFETLQAGYRNAPPRPFWNVDPSFSGVGFSIIGRQNDLFVRLFCICCPPCRCSWSRTNRIKARQIRRINHCIELDYSETTPNQVTCKPSEDVWYLRLPLLSWGQCKLLRN